MTRGSKMKLTEKTINSIKKFECSFMELYEDKVLLPNDQESVRTYIKHNGGAAVLPITKDNNIVLVNQYRYPIKSLSIEVPAGKKDSPNELGIDCVKRELEEETGYKSSNIEFVSIIHSCVGYSNEIIELFIAKNCEIVDNPKQCDEEEFIELLIFSKDQVLELLLNNKITDAKTIILLQYYFLKENN
jgi:ADP-ribose pyrophosphatase